MLERAVTEMVTVPSKLADTREPLRVITTPVVLNVSWPSGSSRLVSNVTVWLLTCTWIVSFGLRSHRTVMGFRLLVLYLAAKAMKLVAWAELVWAVRPCSRKEEFLSQARTSRKSPSPLKV